jgi:hypothetical protein
MSRADSGHKLKGTAKSKYEEAVILADDLRKKYLKASAKKRNQPVELARAAMDASATLAQHASNRAA